MNINTNIAVIPTIVPSSQQTLLDTARQYSFAPALHIDINDGTFAAPQTWPHAGESLMLPSTQCHAHLMMQEPLHLASRLVEAGIDTLYVHAEVMNKKSFENIAVWRAQGLQRFGVALLIDTPLEIVRQYRDMIDTVLLLSVAHIGVQGNPFDERVYARISQLREFFPDARVAVDGGINITSIGRIVQAGAQIVYVGSAISRAEDPHHAYTELLTIANSAVQ